MSLAFNGGVYGDYEVAKSTRVLENRSNYNKVYLMKLIRSSNEAAIYTGAFCTISGFILGNMYFEKIYQSKRLKLYSFLGAILSGYIGFKISNLYLCDRNYYKYLLKNKHEVIEKIKQAQIEDYNDRNSIFPQLDQKNKESSKESEEELASNDEENSEDDE